VLRWRLIIGTALVALLLGLFWLDVRAAQPGVYFLFLGIVISALAVEELLAMFRAVGHQPHAWAVRVGTLATFVISCAPIIRPQTWSFDPLIGMVWGMVIGLAINIVVEIYSFVASGKSINNLATAAFAMLYLGGLLSFFVQLRLLPIGGDVARGGMLALFSMIAIVKFTDIGAYFGGRKWGRHKMAPIISPGKTWEGAACGLVVGILAGFVMLGPVRSALDVQFASGRLQWFIGALVYGMVVSAAGMIGDLAESLLKRDAGMKDSSTWLPGFGGVLDLMDSLLFAAPVAYALWISGIVGG
jgi:phosphatidate cytidylyltransferase